MDDRNAITRTGEIEDQTSIETCHDVLLSRCLRLKLTISTVKFRG